MMAVRPDAGPDSHHARQVLVLARMDKNENRMRRPGPGTACGTPETKTSQRSHTAAPNFSCSVVMLPALAITAAVRA